MQLAAGTPPAPGLVLSLRAAAGSRMAGQGVWGGGEAACILLLIIPACVNHANVLSDNSPSRLLI